MRGSLLVLLGQFLSILSANRLRQPASHASQSTKSSLSLLTTGKAEAEEDRDAKESGCFLAVFAHAVPA